jgi:excisionase family DNA binding protein
MKNEPEWLLSQEAAEYMRVSTRTLRELVDKRELPYSMLEGKMLFNRHRLDAYLFNLEVTADKVAAEKNSESEPQIIYQETNHEEIMSLIKKLCDHSDHFVKSLGRSLENDLKSSDFKELSKKTRTNLSHWCWPRRLGDREIETQKIAHKFSTLLYGHIIPRND